MSTLFESVSINGLILKNRFVRSATWEGMADEKGVCTPRLTEYMRQLALGQVGLVISGHCFVQPAGQASFRQIGVYDDALVRGLAEMVGAVHEAGGAMVLQLAHAGCHANVELTGPMKQVGSALCNAVVSGDVAAVKAAIDAGAAAAAEAGSEVISAHVIARPDETIDGVLPQAPAARAPRK